MPAPSHLRRGRPRPAAGLAFLAVAAALLVGSLGVGAQEARWRIVQGPDGTLYLLKDGLRHRVVPERLSQEDLDAIPDGDTYEAEIPLPTPQAAIIVATPTANPLPPPPPRGAVDTAGTILRVLQVERPVAYPRGETPRPGRELVVVTVQYENRGTEEESYNPYEFRLQTSDLFVMEHLPLRSLDGYLTFGRIPAGGTVRGKLAFEVPPGVPHTVLYWEKRGRVYAIDIT